MDGDVAGRQAGRRQYAFIVVVVVQPRIANAHGADVTNELTSRHHRRRWTVPRRRRRRPPFLTL
jgi:hypothetical protein